MTDTQVEKVKRLLTEMDSIQRATILKFLKEYDDGTLERRGSIRESLNKSLGPTSSFACSYCGK